MGRPGANQREPLDFARPGNERFFDVADAVDLAEVAGRGAGNVQRQPLPVLLDERLERNGGEKGGEQRRA